MFACRLTNGVRRVVTFPRAARTAGALERRGHPAHDASDIRVNRGQHLRWPRLGHQIGVELHKTQDEYAAKFVRKLY